MTMRDDSNRRYPISRRDLTLGTLFGAFVTAVAEVAVQKAGIEVASMIWPEPHQSLFGQTFSAWITAGPGRIKVEAFAIRPSTATQNHLVIEVKRVVDCARGPVLCAEAWEVQVQAIISELKKKDFLLEVDWKNVEWGAFEAQKKYFVDPFSEAIISQPAKV